MPPVRQSVASSAPANATALRTSSAVSASAAASSILGRNLLVYGLGGVIVPFIGIKLIDLVVGLIPGFSS
ncbi:hypothetical protein IAE22_31455 [Bacillus sp. S34]|nr:hypothetical protein [Bacillus sp. S34]